jgi:peptidoglycan biosynthesis protein MviN/MurJ (putative lipid II flippase)
LLKPKGLAPVFSNLFSVCGLSLVFASFLFPGKREAVVAVTTGGLAEVEASMYSSSDIEASDELESSSPKKNLGLDVVDEPVALLA